MLAETTVQLRLPLPFVGQILDGLEILTEQWESTAAYMEELLPAEFDDTIRECSNANEAYSIATFYKRIRNTILNQVGEESPADAQS